MRCERWRRYGSFMTLGPVTWEQCRDDAIVNLTVTEDDKTETLPACHSCWQECIEYKIPISEAVPIKKDE